MRITSSFGQRGGTFTVFRSKNHPPIGIFSLTLSYRYNLKRGRGILFALCSFGAEFENCKNFPRFRHMAHAPMGHWGENIFATGLTAGRSRNQSNGVEAQSAQRLGSRSQRNASASVASFELRALCDEIGLRNSGRSAHRKTSDSDLPTPPGGPARGGDND